MSKRASTTRKFLEALLAGRDERKIGTWTILRKDGTIHVCTPQLLELHKRNAHSSEIKPLTEALKNTIPAPITDEELEAIE